MPRSRILVRGITPPKLKYQRYGVFKKSIFSLRFYFRTDFSILTLNRNGRQAETPVDWRDSRRSRR